MASTRPGIVNSSRMISTGSPAFFTAAAVTGPMQAMRICCGSEKPFPMISIKLVTVEGLVKVMTSTFPAAMSGSRSSFFRSEAMVR